MAYIIKAYTYNGEFYGYAAEHPDEPGLPYYDNKLANAIRFETYADADNYLDRFTDTSELEFIIIETKE